MRSALIALSALATVFIPDAAFAVGMERTGPPLSSHPLGIVSLVVFVLAYILVVTEEFTDMKKSKPVLLAAGIMWTLIAIGYDSMGQEAYAGNAIRHTILEYGELFLFLLVAMTYINSMEERRIFLALRAWMVRKGFSYRQLFWITGGITFFLSPIADNLTTALLMCAVVMAVGHGDKRYVSLSCINIVVAANAGGAFSPFGDITTLMVWQKGIVEFQQFLYLFIPSVVNYIIPAVFIYMAIPKEHPKASEEKVVMKRGAKRIMLLFVATIITAICYHHFLHLPPTVGMMTGLAYLKFLGYYLKKTHGKGAYEHITPQDAMQYQRRQGERVEDMVSEATPFNVFTSVARSEWDTLLFFYGVMLCVGGLGALGYLDIVSKTLYTDMGPTVANSLVGCLSALVDNIPVMFAVLTMHPDMSLGQWQLVTLTAGVGGSLLSVGSAAGVALMGASRGAYTFFGHLKWMPVIALGYIAAIYVHLFVNGWAMEVPANPPVILG